MPKMIYLGILFVLTLLVVAFAGMIREKQDRVSKSSRCCRCSQWHLYHDR